MAQPPLKGRLATKHYSFVIKIGDMIFILEPYISVGDIKFGMSREEVEGLFAEKPKFEHVDFLKRQHLGWNSFSVIFKKNQVEEVTFTPDGSHQVIWSDIDILNDAQIVRKLNKFEKASKTLDSKLYFSLGIALIGNGKDRTLSVFSKKTEKEWKKSVISSNK